MISLEGCFHGEEGLFDVISDSFILKESIVFEWSDVILSSLISIVDLCFDVAASIIMPTLLLALMFSRRSQKRCDKGRDFIIVVI